MPRSSLPAALLVLVAALAGGLPAAAQTVQGRVLTATDDAPVAGALVQLTDSTGAVVARAASTASGGFAVAAPAPGTYHLVIRQIGLEAWRSAAFVLDGARREPVTLRIAPQVYTLPEITVAARRARCGVGLDEGDVLARLLEAAGTALGVAEATADGGEIGFTSDTYLKRLDPKLALEDSTDTDMPGLSRWPIQSAPPDSLGRWGFVRETPAGPVYYGPDARVLFSDWFLAAHCFQVDTAAGSRLSVHFEPERRGRGAALVGQLILDRESLELRSLTFEYVGLPRWVPKGKAGGEIRLSRLPGGAWVPTAWQLRAPVARRTLGRSRPRLGGWVETGGRVIAVYGRNGKVDSALTAALLGIERRRRY